MVAEGYDDCEGDILAAVRAIVGRDVPVVVEVDLHCHFTRAMAEAADAVLAYQEYPHTDILARARQAYRVAAGIAAGRIRPTTAVHDLKMVGIWHTTSSPLKEVVAEMRRLEETGEVVCASLGHGFPWGDVPESGAKLWVTTHDDPAKAQRIVRQLADRLWQAREALRPRLLDVDSALSEAQRSPAGTVVLADVADNAGGGAPGDSTFILQRVLERGIGDSLLGYYWDLGAIAICREAGEGARLRLRVGGKCNTFSGTPVDVDVTVRRVVENHWQEGLDAREPLGCSVHVETDNGTSIVLASVRSQVFHPSGFSQLGVDPWRKRLVVVKSTHHFYAGFGRDAARVLYVSTPGALRQDFENIPYVKRDLHYWPRVAEPRTD
jgi:microcystin degradation protein MlrC